jgi:hypothetical protein
MSVGAWESQASIFHSLEVTKYAHESSIVSGGRVFCRPDQCSRNSYVDDNSSLISE